eukprot:6585422-Prymnesium_polylepis.1
MWCENICPFDADGSCDVGLCNPNLDMRHREQATSKAGTPPNPHTRHRMVEMERLLRTAALERTAKIAALAKCSHRALTPHHHTTVPATIATRPYEQRWHAQRGADGGAC